MKQPIVKTAYLYFKILLLTVITSSFLGCIAFSRLTEPHTARTLGKGNDEVNLSGGGFIAPKEDKPDSALHFFPYYISAEYKRGISDNFDLGISAGTQYNVPRIGLEGKYQFMHNAGHALSLFFGTGVYYYLEGGESFSGYFSYIGPVYSFKPSNYYELALNVRINQAYIGSVNYTIFNKEDKTESGHLLYGSTNISNTLWFSSHFGTTLSLGLMYIFNTTKPDDTDKPEYKKLLGNLGLKLHTNF